MTVHRLVLVEWMDAAGMPDRLAGWAKVDDIVNYCAAVLIKSVGWVIVDNDQRLVICPNLSADEYGDSSTAIPKAWIKRVTELQERRPKRVPAQGGNHGA